MNKPLKEKHTEIDEAIKNDVSMAAIAREYGVSRQAVWDYCHKYFELKAGNCKECGTALTRIGSKWCSEVCRKKKYKPTHECVCKHCGKHVMKFRESHFCSIQCARATVHKLHADQILERYKKGETFQEIADSLNSTPRSLLTCIYRAGLKLTGQLQKKCARCGTQFGGTHVKKYCSPECQKEAE